MHSYVHHKDHLPSSGAAGCVGLDAHLCPSLGHRSRLPPTCTGSSCGNIATYLLFYRFQSGGHDGAPLSTPQRGVFTALGRLELLSCHSLLSLQQENIIREDSDVDVRKREQQFSRSSADHGVPMKRHSSGKASSRGVSSLIPHL